MELYSAKSIEYSKAIYSLINMQLIVAESKAYEGRHRLPTYDPYLTTKHMQPRGKPQNPEKNLQITREINNSTHINVVSCVYIGRVDI